MSHALFLRKSTYRRYGIFVLTLFFSLYTIQARINYKSIQDSIFQAKEDITTIQEEIDFMGKRYKSYLDSDYASYFLGHENGQLYGGESLVVIEQRKPDLVEEEEPIALSENLTTPDEIDLGTPESSRHYFIDQNLQPLRWLGIIK